MKHTKEKFYFPTAQITLICNYPISLWLVVMCVLVKELRNLYFLVQGRGKRRNNVGIMRLLNLQRKITVQISFSEMAGFKLQCWITCCEKVLVRPFKFFVIYPVILGKGKTALCRGGNWDRHQYLSRRCQLFARLKARHFTYFIPS